MGTNAHSIVLETNGYLTAKTYAEMTTKPFSSQTAEAPCPKRYPTSNAKPLNTRSNRHKGSYYHSDSITHLQAEGPQGVGRNGHKSSNYPSDSITHPQAEGPQGMGRNGHNGSYYHSDSITNPQVERPQGMDSSDIHIPSLQNKDAPATCRTSYSASSVNIPGAHSNGHNTICRSVIYTQAKGPQDYPPDIDALLDKVETSDVEICYQPLPGNVQEMINRICSKHRVKCAVWSQSLSDWRKITIKGTGATKILDDLTKEEKEYPEFTFVAKESGPLHTKQCRNIVLSVHHKTVGEVAPEWTDVASATCDLIVTGEEKDKDNPQLSGEALFAVVSAHSLIHEALCDEFLEDKIESEQIREIVNAKWMYHRYALKLTMDDITLLTLDVKHPAMIAFRHYYSKINRPTGEDPESWKCSAGKCSARESRSCPHESKNDIALLPIEPEEASRLKLHIANNTDKYWALDYEMIYPLKPNHLDKFITQKKKIYAGEYECVMVPSYHPIDAMLSETYAADISFITADSRDTLAEGDSGTIIYLLADGRRYALAKMTGIRSGNDDDYQIYHAILLEQALRDIEIDYPHHVESLRPLRIGTQSSAQQSGTVRPAVIQL